MVRRYDLYEVYRLMRFGLICAMLAFQALPASGNDLSSAEQLQNARNAAEMIDLELSDLVLAQRPLDGVSAEGAMVLGYRTQDDSQTQVKKIVLEALGETFQQRSAFYFRNAKLFYAVEAMFKYDKQLESGTDVPNRILTKINRVAVKDGKILAWDRMGKDEDQKCLRDQSHRLNALSRSLMLLLETPDSKNEGACGWVCTQGEYSDCGHFECVD